MQATPRDAANAVRTAEAHGWIGTATVKSRLGHFDFVGGYPTDDTARRIAEQVLYNRAVEVYVEQIPVVSAFHVWLGTAEAGAALPNQLVIWESLMDAETLFLAGSPETPFALCALDLDRYGATVVEIPPGVTGGITDLWQHQIVEIGPHAVGAGGGEKILLLPPDFDDVPPHGYHVLRSPTYRAVLGLRGSVTHDDRDEIVTLLKFTRIYPLSRADHPPAMTFVDASQRPVDLVFPEDSRFFEDLARIIEQEPAARMTMQQRSQLAAVGIEKGRVFAPGRDRQPLLDDAARFGAAVARANSFASTDPARLAYPDRRWEWAFVGGRKSWDAHWYLNSDRRAAFAYMAFGMTPPMSHPVAGEGSECLWTARDSNGAFLDGGKRYHLLLPPRIPAKQFWSVVAYDAVSRSMLHNGRNLPTISPHTNPDVNSDGSVDVFFGPAAPPGHEQNWVKTIPGRGWFPMLRFHGPLGSFFDKTWKPDDVVEVKYAVPAVTVRGHLW